MSTRSGRVRTSVGNTSPIRTRKGISPVRSPARTRKSSPRKSSPARLAQKSPSRKSPSRKSESKFPARKSPSRTTKEIKQTAEIEPQVVQKSPVKRPAIKTDVAVRLVDVASKVETLQSTRSKLFEYTIKDVLPPQFTQNEIVLGKLNGLDTIDFNYGLRNRSVDTELTPRRSSRLREIKDKFEDFQRSVSKSLTHSKSVSKSIENLSDQENTDEEFINHKEKSKSVTRKLATPRRSSICNLTTVSSNWEYGGRVGVALIMFLIPMIVFSTLISCTHSCSLHIDLNKYKNLKFWFNLRSLALISIQLLIQALFAVIPIFGTRAYLMDGTNDKYCFNAFFASIFTIKLTYVLQYVQVISKKAILNEYLQLAVTAYTFGFILSLAVYIKSYGIKNLNSYGNTGYRWYDFFMGREVHCYISKLNVKVWISRYCNITSIILLLLILSQGVDLQLKDKQLSIENYKEILNKVQLQPTIIVFTLMQIIYILYFIVNEYKMTSTFFWQSEGVGYLQIVSSALYPYYFTTISKYVADNNLTLSTNALVLASVLFTLGFFIMLSSNTIKHKFRANPLHPSLANLESMPTFHGNKLLISGLWGTLRHPNYTGDVLIHIALSLPGFLSQKYFAAMPAILTIFSLGYRTWRDHHRCRSRYGAAWQRYCKKVPSVIIPKVL